MYKITGGIVQSVRENGANRLHVCINRRLADDITSIRDENAARHFHRKEGGGAPPSSVETFVGV